MKPESKKETEKSNVNVSNPTSKSSGGGQTHASNSETVQNNSIRPSLSLPKGGGAISGIGEKFQANPVTGTGSMSIPIAMTVGRGGFSPQLSLSYDSGAGNGAFGLGWNVGLASISRKTDKKLPRYIDHYNNEDSIDAASETFPDTFILSGAEDLVPVITADNKRKIENITEDEITYKVHYYRPRTEGLFARITFWQPANGEPGHWRTTSKDNITSIYGKIADSRIYDPENVKHIFTWLIQESYDAKGNLIQYQYKSEDGTNIPVAAYERNRHSYAQKYIKKILYANSSPYTPGVPYTGEWIYSLVFDYGEHGNDSIEGNQLWACRKDIFSYNKAGFEIRSYRLCKRILMYHQYYKEKNPLANPIPAPELCKSTVLNYQEDPVATYLTSISHKGYQEGETESYPPVSFTYSQAQIASSSSAIDPSLLGNAPIGIQGQGYSWTDLYGEGISGILKQDMQAWYYQSNYGDSQYYETNKAPIQNNTEDRLLLGGMRRLAQKPNASKGQLTDIDGDGLPELLVQEAHLKGYYTLNEDGNWESFQHFRSNPNINWNDKNLRMLDLDGDGHADILLSEDNCFTMYYSLGKQGYTAPSRQYKANEQEQGPAIVFSSIDQSIFIADMSGDGLSDIVRIRNGEVCYWPNLGYGRFGKKVSMHNAPRFDTPDLFNPRYIQLADVDGSGTTDIIYTANGKLNYWKNQSGNTWSDAIPIKGISGADSHSQLILADLFGNGTQCLVWQSQLPAYKGQVRYLELTSGVKPHLLTAVDNHRGGVTQLYYAPSTKFYLRDKVSGKPWISKLPFPVHVLEKVEVIDLVNNNRFVNRYAYHHGYYDRNEREFRGFGMVEQWDTMEQLSTEYANENTISYLPPAHSKTWFHNGFYNKKENISACYTTEYYPANVNGSLLPDTILPTDLNYEEEREAARALRGSVLRREVYADDNTAKASKPYSIEEKSYNLKVLQRKRDQAHAVFHVTEEESIGLQYERTDEARITHQCNLSVDAWGNITQALQIAYGRKTGNLSAQKETLAVYTNTDFINTPDQVDVPDDTYYIGVPCQVKQYQVTGLDITEITNIATLRSKMASAIEIAYEINPDISKIQKRLISHQKHFFCSLSPDYNNESSSRLDLGYIARHGLPYRSYTLAMSNGILQNKFFAANQLADGSKYNSMLALETLSLFKNSRNIAFNHYEAETISSVITLYWQKGEMQQYDIAQFCQPVKYVDPMDNKSSIYYDTAWLNIIKLTDPYNFTTTLEYNYSQVKPYRIIDVNDNYSEVAYSPLGLVKALAVRGKIKKDANGDPLFDPITQLPLHEYDSLTDPTEVFIYNLHEWENNGKPVWVHHLQREKYGTANGANNTWPVLKDKPGIGVGLYTQWLETITYLDGTGQETLTKHKDENGVSISLVGDELQQSSIEGTRWASNSRVILNNKGKAWREFEPYFTPSYTFENYYLANNASSFIHYVQHTYDPLGRLIRSDMPDGTYSKVEFDAWQQQNWDANDTVADSVWYDRYSKGSDAQKRAAALALVHAATPQSLYLDPLGRPIKTVDRNKIHANSTVEEVETSLSLDIAGRTLTMTDALGREATRNTYDMAGNLIVSYNIDSGIRFGLYNNAQLPVLSWDNKNNRFYHYYDYLLRDTVLDKYVPSISTAFRVQTKTYGAHNVYNNINKLYLSYHSGGRSHYTYDHLGNIIYDRYIPFANYQEEVNVLNVSLSGETIASANTYDALSRPISKTRQDNSKDTYTYNTAGLLKSVSMRTRVNGVFKAYISDIKYNEKGQRTEVYYGNNSKTRYEYDPCNFRLTRLLTTRGSGNEVVQDINYTYDAVGNIVEILDNAQKTLYFSNMEIEARQQFTYDALYRLLKATGREKDQLGMPTEADIELYPVSSKGQASNYTQNFAYDKLGNILKIQHTAAQSPNSWTRDYVYESINNRLLKHDSSQANAVYTYDAHGNMLTMPHLPTMEWDSLDHLHKSVRGNDTTWYKYDTDGNRRRKITDKQNGTRVERIYHGDYELYREYNADNTIKEETRTVHVSDGERRIATVDYKTVENGVAITSYNDITRYQYDNHLGSACLELDANALTITYEEYHPFGTSSYKLADNDTEVKRKRYRYVGKERDEETGLYYYGARYYAAWIGRWTAVEPLKEKYPNLSTYCYCANNPIKYIDPDGMQWDETNNTKEIVDNFKIQIEKQTNKINKEITDLKSTQALYGEDSKIYKSIQQKIINMEEKIKEFEQINTELSEMEENTKVTYRLGWIKEDPSVQTYKAENGKLYEKNINDKTTYKDGKVIMKYNRGNYSSLAHELKHGYQFLKGEISFNLEGKGGYLYDLTDEQVAWRRGSLFEVGDYEPLKNYTIEDIKNFKYNIKSEIALNMLTSISTIEKENGVEFSIQKENKHINYGQYARGMENDINIMKFK